VSRFCRWRRRCSRCEPYSGIRHTHPARSSDVIVVASSSSSCSLYEQAVAVPLKGVRGRLRGSSHSVVAAQSPLTSWGESTDHARLRNCLRSSGPRWERIVRNPVSISEAPLPESAGWAARATRFIRATGRARLPDRGSRPRRRRGPGGSCKATRRDRAAMQRSRLSVGPRLGPSCEDAPVLRARNPLGRAGFESGPGWIRTTDQRIMSPLL
jgi:hypothetical protein